MKGVKILVVDDDQLVLDATSLVLERAGYVVDKTSDVIGLPLRVGGFRPEAILLDLDMPAISGDKVAVHLKHLRAMTDCKIIFHSARLEPSLEAAVRATGAAGYISKGLGRYAFLQSLRTLLGPVQK